MAISSYPNGFNYGVSIRGMPLLQSYPGNVYWLDSVNGSDGNPGTFTLPVATLTTALVQCTANQGDIIMVKPGHAETISTAAGIVLSKAGVAIIGMGVGSKRPTFTWSAATSTITITANNIAIQNFLFLGTAATTFTATAFSNANAVVGNDFIIDSCEFRDSDATHGFIACYTGGTTANQSDGLTFTNNRVLRYLTSPPAANTAVVTQAAIDRLTFSGNFIVNKTVNNNVAVGFALGSNAVQNLQCNGNRTYSLNITNTAGELFSGGSTSSSGLLYDNICWTLAASAGAGLLCPLNTKIGMGAGNYSGITGAHDKQAALNPLAT
mgnify:CR=1 FL=1